MRVAGEWTIRLVGWGRVPLSARDTRGWYPSPHPGGRTRATVLPATAEPRKSHLRQQLGSQAGVPAPLPPFTLESRADGGGL